MPYAMYKTLLKFKTRNPHIVSLSLEVFAGVPSYSAFICSKDPLAQLSMVLLFEKQVDDGLSSCHLNMLVPICIERIVERFGF